MIYRAPATVQDHEPEQYPRQIEHVRALDPCLQQRTDDQHSRLGLDPRTECAYNASRDIR